MDPLLSSWLSGTLRSDGPAVMSTDFSFTNNLDTLATLGFVGTDGRAYPVFIAVPPGGTEPAPLQVPINWYWVVFGLDKSVIAVFPGGLANSGGLKITLDGSDVSSPGDIGPIPEPMPDVPVPNDSPSVMVGCGRIPNGFLIRSQFWKRMTDSLSLAPKEVLTSSYTTTTGIQTTSSDTETVATSISSSASAGIGSISASISASLNTSSTHFQQYVTTETDTVFEQRVYNGDEVDTITILRWSLYDVVTIYDGSGSGQPVIAAQVTTAAKPDVVKAYRVSQLQAAAAPTALTVEARDELRAVLASMQSGTPRSVPH